MLTSKRNLLLAAASMLAAFVVTLIAWNAATAQPALPEPEQKSVPTDQTYIGAKLCSACHFKQYMAWKRTKHAGKAFEELPDAYRTDSACLPCHTTGYGAPSGYKDATTPNLAGVTCEVCHGPGSKHETMAKQFANKKLSPAEEKGVRDAIWRIRPGNICVTCHVDKGHHEHPKYSK